MNQIDEFSQIEDVLYWFMKVLGLIGNGLLLAIYFQPSLRKLSVSVYIRAMAASSFLDAISYLYFQYFDPGINKSSLICKLAKYLYYIFIPMCVWFELVAAIDRLLTIVYPMRFRFIQKLKFQVSIILTIVFYNLIFYIMILVDFSVNTVISEEKEIPIEVCDKTNIDVFSLVDFVNSIAVPFCLMVFTSFLTTIGILKARRRIRLSSFGILKNREKVNRRDVKFGITLIFLNGIFFIMTTPFSINNFYDINPYKANNDSLNYSLFDLVLCFLYESYFSIIFYVQFSFNSLVRKEFFKIFKRLFCFSKHSKRKSNGLVTVNSFKK